MSLRRFSFQRSDVLCCVAILALSTFFLFPALRPGYTLLPLGLEAGIAPWHKQVTQQSQNSLLSDPFYTFYPRRNFFTTSLRNGTYPLWNPHIFSGHPVVGDTAAQTFYPLNFMAAQFLSAARALPILAWFHLTLTGLAMFVFLRLLRLRSGAALFGALAWMFNGDTIVWLENPHRLSTLAWMPVVFLFYELALQKRRVWPGILAAFFYGLAILGGHTQFALGLGVALAAYGFFRTCVLSWTERRLAWWPLAMLATVGLLGIGMGAIQLLPTFQMAQLSHRATLSTSQFLATRWPPKHVVGLWIPDFYGNPVRFPYWGATNYAEVTAYLGAFAFPLALSSLLWVRSSRGRFFGVAVLFVLLIAWATPLVWLVAWVPGFRYFRLVSLTAYLPLFGAAAAAFGLEKGFTLAVRRERLLWTTLLFVLAGLTVTTLFIVKLNGEEVAAHWPDIYPYLWRTVLIWGIGMLGLLLARWRPAQATVLLVALLAVDLIQWGRPFNPVNSLDILYPENGVTAWLRQDASLYRVLPLQTDRPVFGPNILSVFGFYETGGYSSLMVQRYRDLVKAIDDQVAIWWMRPNRNMLVNSRFQPLFSLLNVKYVLTSHPLEGPLFSVEAAYPGCDGPAVLLTGGTRFTHSFRALHPGLNRVDVEFVRVGDPSGQPLRFFLWRDRPEGELVADVTLDGGTLPEQGVQAFFFAPVPDSSGQTFVWAVEAPETAQEATVAICQAQDEPDDWPAFAAYGVQLQHVDIQQGVWIYENPNVLPRAYIVHRAEVVPDQALLERLTAQDFNPWTTVLLETPLPASQSAQLADAPLRSGSVAHITRYDLQQVEIAAEMMSPGVLVLSDQWYPGWQVTVDGKAAPLLRVNYALRGVYLPAGAHRVVFRFNSLPLYLGLTLAGLALVCGVGAIVWDVRRAAGVANKGAPT